MKVVARFAFYWDPFNDGEFQTRPLESYIITESDVPSLPVGGNVDGEALLAAGVPLPVTPTYETWVRMGKPVYRGEVAA